MMKTRSFDVLCKKMRFYSGEVHFFTFFASGWGFFYIFFIFLQLHPFTNGRVYNILTNRKKDTLYGVFSISNTHICKAEKARKDKWKKNAEK